MTHEHSFHAAIRWTGNRGQGNATYRGYDRTWEVNTEGKPVIQCSNDPMLGGDPTLHNPEDLLVNAVSSCHMLWYLHLAFDAGVLVTGYEDTPEGIGVSDSSGAGQFKKVILRPRITLGPGMDPVKADGVHAKIHDVCFIARSVNFPIEYKAKYVVAS